MFKKLSVSVLLYFFFFSSSIMLYAQWARTYGGSDYDYAWSIQQTNDGGYIVAGSTASFGAGEYDIWVLKLDSDGNIQWQRTYGGINTELAWEYDFSIQQTSDQGYIIAGHTNSFGAGDCDFWILKLSANGDVEWQRTYGGGQEDCARSIKQSGDGGYIVAGHTLSFGAGGMDFWVLKLASNGDIEWQRTYGGNAYEYDCYIQQTSDGGYIVAGDTRSFGAGGDDFWVLKLDLNGDIEWQRTYGGSSWDYLHSIQQTSDEGYIIAGHTCSFGDGTEEAWILKLYSNGDIEWQRIYRGNGEGVARSIQQTSDGGYIVAGDTDSFGDLGDINGWVLKLSSNGDIEWQYTYGGGNTDYASRSIDQTSDGGYVTAGWTYSFGNGEANISVLKLYSDGEIAPTCVLLGNSDALIVETSISPENTNVTPADTNVTPADTDCTTQDTEVVANLLCEAPKYSLTISTTDRGTTEPAPDSYTHYDRTEVQIEAIPDDGYDFFYWSGDVPSGLENDNPITITMNSNKSIKAHFQYTLTIAAGAGGTTNPAPGSYEYDPGTQVNITAIPDDNYRFNKWTGNVTAENENDNPLTITMDSDKSIEATFIRQCTLTIAAGTGGTTDPAPGNYEHDTGTQVTVTATANTGYQFSGWSGDASGTSNPITVTMDEDKSITANFTQIPIDGDSDKGGGGACFIATATYGSPLHPHLDILRDFRDKYLIHNKLGQAYLELYYEYSPFFAEVIAKNKILKIAAQINLMPFIVFSFTMNTLGPWFSGATLIFILLFSYIFVKFS